MCDVQLEALRLWAITINRRDRNCKALPGRNWGFSLPRFQIKISRLEV